MAIIEVDGHTSQHFIHLGFDGNYDGVEDIRVELSVLSDAKQCVEHILLLKPEQRRDHQELA
jgi:hypothetical protein